MNPSIELQKQIKDNAEELRHFVSDMSNWEKEMKRKESEARAASSKENSVPPVRNTCKKRDNCGTSNINNSPDAKGAKKRISSNDYAAWEKFDVEKACEEVEGSASDVKSDSEDERQILEKRLRDEANVEKEKGNNFVKKEKWDSAIECYSKAIKCYSRDAIFYCNRALCYLKKKDYRAAETDCTSAIMLDGTYVKALHRRGLARKELNQLKEAAADLQRAAEIEPSNTAILRDYNAILLKTGEHNLNSILATETIQIETEAISDISGEKKADPILPAKKHRPSGGTQKEPKELKELKESSSKKQTSSYSSWPELEGCAVIESISVPPHKRSKKPLQRIQIQEDGGLSISSVLGKAGSPDLPVQSASDRYANLEPKAVADCLEKKKEEISVAKDNDSKLKVSISKPVSNVETTMNSAKSAHIIVPPTPKNSVQFLSAWRQISNNRSICHQYLKQIKGEDLPKIFYDSLDGNVLSQILVVLATEFTMANDPVLTYLQGLTRVRRFRTLTLFLSTLDKENLKTLFSHIEIHEKASSDVIGSLKKEFEL